MKALLLIAICLSSAGCAVGYSSKDGWYGKVVVTPENIDRVINRDKGYAK